MDKNKNWSIWLGVFIFSVVIIYSLTRDFYRKDKLENLTKGKAIIIKYSTGTSKHGKRGYFEYIVSGKKYKFIQQGDFSSFEIGDTLEIEYSIEDNSVARVIKNQINDK